MSRFLAYLLPTNPIALVLVLFLWGLFIVWVAWLRRHRAQLARNRDNVHTLLKLTDRLVHLQGSRDLAAGRDGYAHLVQDQGVDPDDPIARHVESILVAGATQGRLDLAELTRHTEFSLLHGELPRRYLLSLFIIVGLLGTLFGLADSLAELSAGVGGVGGTRKNLELLLAGLRSAFAPSIWGVALSIVSTLIFTWHQARIVAPVLQSLRAATVSTWVPRLYPTTVQRLDGTLARSLEAAAAVATLAGDVRRDTGELSQTLRSSVELADDFRVRVESLATALRQGDQDLQARLSELGQRTAEWGAAIERWTQNEADIRRIQSDIAAQQATQADLLRQARDAIVGLQRPFVDLTNAVVRELQETRATHHDLADRLSTTIKNWQGSVTAHVDAQTREVMTHLGRLDTSLHSLRVPFDSAADKITNAAVGFQHFAENILRSRNGDAPTPRPSADDPQGLRRIERILRDIAQELKRNQAAQPPTLSVRFKKLLRL